MLLRRTFLILLSSALLLPAAGTRKLTITDALGIRVVQAPRISPDGNWVAWTQTEWDQKNNRQVSHLWIARSAGNGTPAKLTNSEKGETVPQWSPDSTRIAFLSDRGGADSKAGNQVWMIRPDGGEADRLTSEETPVSEFTWSSDGKQIAFVTRDTPADKADREKRKKDKFDAIVVDSDYTYAHLWTLDVATRAKKRLTQGSYSVSTPRYSPDSRQIAFVYSTMGSQESSFFDLNADRNTDIHVIGAEGGAPRKLTTSTGSDTSPAWSPDGAWIAYVHQPDPKVWAGKSDILVIAAAGGSPKNLTAEFRDSAGAGVKWSPDGKNLYWHSQEGLFHHIFRVPASGGKIAHITEGNRMHNDFDLARDGNKAVVLADPGNAPADIWSLDLNGSGGGRNRISNANPQIDEFAIAKAEPVRWKGPDDFDVEGLLTYPLDYTPGKKVPLILNIHGGPYGAHSGRFDTRAQIFAANGYAVLAPNPRGSTGYGMKFEQANVSDWGGKDFGDLMAGVDSLVARGIADPGKLLVMGGSYGGFMTFWTITQTNRFKAAIGHAGISDWYSFHGQSDIPGLMEYGFGGQPWVSTGTYRKFSPMSYVDKVKTPILITHGEQDRRVPIAQAEQYYRALKGVGVKTVFLRYPREGHGITEPNHQIDLVGRQLEWFAQHLSQ